MDSLEVEEDKRIPGLCNSSRSRHAFCHSSVEGLGFMALLDRQCPV